VFDVLQEHEAGVTATAPRYLMLYYLDISEHIHMTDAYKLMLDAIKLLRN
jgi:hypothetical protein